MIFATLPTFQPPFPAPATWTDIELAPPPGSWKPAQLMGRDKLLRYTPLTEPLWQAARKIGQHHVTWWYIVRWTDLTSLILP